MPTTNFPNGLTSMGVPLPAMGIPSTFGNYFFVDAVNGSDGNTGRSMTQAYQTIAQAYSQTVTNNDDVICIRGTATDNVLTSMLTVSNNRVHFVGLDGAWRPYGQGPKISMTATTGATNVSTIKNTGTRNTFTNIKFTNNSTVAQSLYTVQESGQYSQYTNCEFYLSTNLGTSGASELACNADSATFSHCNFGSLADALTSGATVRACVLLTNGIVSGGYSPATRDTLFEDCLFWRNAEATTNTFVYTSGADDVERMLLFRRCGFVNSQLASAVPAQAIRGAVALTNGNIILDPECWGANVTKISTTTGVLVTGPGTNASSGIAVNAA